MDVYYRKLMGNGTVASKFKLDYKNPPQDAEPASATSSSSTPRDCSAPNPTSAPVPEATSSSKPATAATFQVMSSSPLQSVTTHHDSNCVRCYKLKKKCSRSYPRCDYCLKSNTACEYVDRKKKMPKLGASTHGTITTISNSGSAPARAAESGRQILIASLVNSDETEPSFRNIELPYATRNGAEAGQLLMPQRTGSGPVGLRRGGALSASGHGSVMSLNNNIISSGRVEHDAEDPRAQFLSVRPFENINLPSAFVHTFFANYEWEYPFLSRGRYVGQLKDLSFSSETLVKLDVYLVMAIGCLIYDASKRTSHFGMYFSHAHVESVVHMISYDIKSEEDIHKAHLLILLSIYAVNVGDVNLIWNIVGFLNRLILFMTDFTGGDSPCFQKRCFWTVFNLDKELSLMLDKPSQFLPTAIIPIDSKFTASIEDNESTTVADLASKAVELRKLQDRMLSYRLRLAVVDETALKQFSADLEGWRVSISSLVHTEYAESPLLQNYIGLVNLNYYYLLIELDQLSATESFQFTLQFLSNSFSLLLSDSVEAKDSGGTSIYTLYWFLKLFKVLDYNIVSVVRMLDAEVTQTDLALRLNDFNTNMQLGVNLVKFLLNSDSRPARFVPKLEMYLGRLKGLGSKLTAFNPHAKSPEEIRALGREIADLVKQ